MSGVLPLVLKAASTGCIQGAADLCVSPHQAASTLLLAGIISAHAGCCSSQVLMQSQEVIIMCNACDTCGYKNSEIKGAGAISATGRKITLRVQEAADLSRDVIKADSARLSIPEVELEVTSGSMGGLITTVEGLVVAISEALRSTHSFQLGDSATQAGPAWPQSVESCIIISQSKLQTLCCRSRMTWLVSIPARLQRNHLPEEQLG